MLLTAKGDFLLEDDNFESFKRGKWSLASPIDSNLTKIHLAKAYVFSDSVLCSGGHAVSKPSENFEGWWMDSRQLGGSNTSKGINAEFLDCEVYVNYSCWRRSNSQSRRLSTTFCQERVSETYRHRIFTEMNELENKDKSHKNDDLRILGGQEFCEYAARFQRGFWFPVGPGSEKT